MLMVEKIESNILLIKLNRPDRLNALNQAVLDELQKTFSQAKNDDSIAGIILTGEGKAFCAGADINRLAEVDAVTGLTFARHGQAVFRQLETLGKPSIAAINGYAFGGGCELAMSATMRIANQTAKLGQPEVKLGVIPGYGGTQRLARLVGKGRALDICLTGRTIDAEEALKIGLISQICDADQLINQAIQTMKIILSMAPIAIKSVMEVIDQGYDLPITEACELEALHFALTCSTEDKKEGVDAFLNKRTANFKGK